MQRAKDKASVDAVDALAGKASWLLSHAEALEAYRRANQAAKEWARAADCEEQLALLLDTAGRRREAALHRASAAACHEKLNQPARAATLLHAALAGELSDALRADLEERLTTCLKRANGQAQRPSRRRPRVARAV